MASRDRKRRRIAAITLTVLIAVTWMFTLRPISLGGPAGYIVVDGASMEPTYHHHDLVITRKDSSYEVGDVIAYSPSTDVYGGAALTIHRIIGTNDDGAYLTQGDNRPTPDQWLARPSDIVGAEWIHVPHVGGWILRMQQPRLLWPLMAGFIGLTVLGGGAAQRKHGRNGSRDKMNASSGFGLPRTPLSGGAIAGLAALGLLAVFLLLLGVVSFRRPTHETVTKETPLYEHTADFEYTVAMERSTLYPDGLVGPIDAADVEPLAQPTATNSGADAAAALEAPGEVDAPPIYLKLARTMNLEVMYQLDSELPADIEGHYSADLLVRAGEDGWETSKELVPPTEFSGSVSTFRVPVDIAALANEIATVEEETGYRPNSYTISVMPTIDIVGELDGQPLENSFAPTFDMTVDSVEITPISPLAITDARADTETLNVQRHIQALGVAVPVRTARIASVVGFLAVTLIAVGSALMILRQLEEDENRMIQFRHSSKLVDVSEVNVAEDAVEIVRLKSMSDLARIAERDGQIIFHEDRGVQGHRYFVPEGTVTYEYSVRHRKT